MSWNVCSLLLMEFDNWQYGSQPQQAPNKQHWRGRFIFAFLWWGSLFAFFDIKYFFTIFLDLSFIGALLLAAKNTNRTKLFSSPLLLDKPIALFLLFCGCCPPFFLLLASFAQFVPPNLDLARVRFSDFEWANIRWAVMFLLSLLGVVSGAVVLACDYHDSEHIESAKQALNQNDRDPFF